jgi:hypothetical protein
MGKRIFVRCFFIAFLILGLMPQFVHSESEFDLPVGFNGLSYIYEGEIVKSYNVDDVMTSVTVEITKAWLGTADVGDVVELQTWELGRYTHIGINDLVVGVKRLFIADENNYVQVIGKWEEGYYRLKGYFDFDGYFASPGVLTPFELQSLIDGNELDYRTVDIDILFPNDSQVLALTAEENEEGWAVTIDDIPANAFSNEIFVSLGGWDSNLDRGFINIDLPLNSNRGEENRSLHLEGSQLSFTNGVYNAKVYGIDPFLLELDDLFDYVSENITPELPKIAVRLSQSAITRLGDNRPESEVYFTIDENAELVLHGWGDTVRHNTSHLMTNDDILTGFTAFSPDEPGATLYFRFSKTLTNTCGVRSMDILEHLFEKPLSGALYFTEGGELPEPGSSEITGFRVFGTYHLSLAEEE